MSNDALTAQMLEWVGHCRSYNDAAEAWKTSCPRLTIWEDAFGEGLVERLPGQHAEDARIMVTEKGRQFLGEWRSR